MPRQVNRFFLVICFLALVAGSLPRAVMCQSTDSSKSTLVQPIAPRKLDPAKLQALKERIEQIKYLKLKTNLGMDEDQARKFFELYKPAEQDIQALARKRNAALEELHALTEGAKSDADVDPLLQDIRGLTEQIQTRQQKLDTDLKPILSPRQRAKLLVFEQEFNRRVREQVARHRMQRRLRNHFQQFRLQRQRLREQLQRPR